MLKDEVSITIVSGTGGNGSMAMNTNYAVGGDGGRGGNVYLLGDENVYDLSSLDNTRTYSAGRGHHGESKRRSGKDGDDLVLRVPLTTEVHVGNRTPYKITKNGEKVLILEGGRGGYGSITIRKNQHDVAGLNMKLDANPEHGKSKDITLVLKLQSDVIFIGYPNAGKSSMLNLLSDANAKVAPYAFTTLEPQLGLMDGVRLMDLPGLIEGTYEGKGLGTKFVKHTENSKLVAHFVSYENPDMMSVYKSLREEIKNISNELYNKPEIIILTKSDEASAEKIIKTEKEFKKICANVVSVSIVDDKAIQIIRDIIKKQIAL